MIYVVTLSYVRPMDDIKAHLDTHKDWLTEHTKAGRIIAAGPMEPPTGGIVLANCADRAELDAMLKSDSFYVHQLVEYEIRCFKPVLCAWAFASDWAPETKGI